jgi:hypothetical protein
MRPAAMQIAADLGTARNPAAARAAPENRSRPLARRFRRTTVRFAATVLTLLCVLSLLSPLAGCASADAAGCTALRPGAVCERRRQLVRQRRFV